MSSIIKSGRARNQGIMNLSERQNTKAMVEEVYEDVASGENQYLQEEPVHLSSSIIEEKKEELQNIQFEIDERLQAADQTAQVIISNAYAKVAELETESKAKQDQIIAEAYEKEKQIIQSANDDARTIRNDALAEKMQMLSEVEGEVVETMISLLQHIISEEVTYHEEWLYLVVKKMLQKSEVEEGTSLFISTKQYELLEKEDKEKLLTLRKLSEVKVDESLNDTTCKLLTSQGSIEYDITQGLDKVISELRILKSLSRSQDDQY